MTYLKITDTPHGELGHNGWTWVIDHPYPADGQDHPAYYEDTGVVTVDPATGRDPQVQFRKNVSPSRSGRNRAADLYILVSNDQYAAARANRHAYDAIHMPIGGWRAITD